MAHPIDDGNIMAEFINISAYNDWNDIVSSRLGYPGSDMEKKEVMGTRYYATPTPEVHPVTLAVIVRLTKRCPVENVPTRRMDRDTAVALGYFSKEEAAQAEADAQAGRFP